MGVKPMPIKMSVIRGGKAKREAVLRKVESVRRQVESAGREAQMVMATDDTTFEQVLAVAGRLGEAARAAAHASIELGICPDCGEKKPAADFDDGDLMCRECVRELMEWSPSEE
jgi:hypothetical protein